MTLVAKTLVGMILVGMILVGMTLVGQAWHRQTKKEKLLTQERRKAWLEAFHNPCRCHQQTG